MRSKTKRLMEENNRDEKALSPEAQSLLTDLVVYLRGASVSLWQQEQVRRDITRMLLDAQARGESARSVIGEDPKAFCDSVLEELSPLPRPQRAAALVRDGLLAASVLVGLWILLGIVEGLLGAGSWPGLTLRWGQLLSGVGILLTAFWLVQWICRNSFESPEKKGPWLLLFVAFFALLCLGVFLRRPLAVLPLPAALGVLAGLLLAYKLLDSRLD